MIDTAKAAAVCLGAGGLAMDHIGMFMMRGKPLPHLVVPTTAGTGSEVTNVAVIHNTDLGRKVYILDDKIIPQTAILDPLTTTGLPASLTARHRHGRAFPRHRIGSEQTRQSRGRRHGPASHPVDHRVSAECVASPEDAEARVPDADRRRHGGVCILQRRDGDSPTAWPMRWVPVCHVHHGSAIGVLLPHVMRFNAKARPEKLSRVARALGCREDGDEALALAGADAVSELLHRIGHPRHLRELGVAKNHLAQCVGLTLADEATLTNPAP